MLFLFLATKENVAENDANKTKLEERNVEIHRNFGYNSNSYKQQKQLQPALDTILRGIHFIEEEKTWKKSMKKGSALKRERALLSVVHWAETLVSF